MLASRSSREGWFFSVGLDIVVRQGMGGREKIGAAVTVVVGFGYQDVIDSRMEMGNGGRS
jgi:hypothetical protein